MSPNNQPTVGHAAGTTELRTIASVYSATRKAQSKPLQAIVNRAPGGGCIPFWVARVRIRTRTERVRILTRGYSARCGARASFAPPSPRLPMPLANAIATLLGMHPHHCSAGVQADGA